MRAHRNAGIALLSFLALTAAAGADEFDCLVAPSRIADVAFPSTGVVSSVAVRRGDTVEAGAVIAALDDQLERANLDIALARAGQAAAEAAARSQFDLAQRQYDRNKQLFDQQNLAAARLDEFVTALESARLRLMEIEENRALYRLDVARARTFLALRSLRSPFAGVVVETHVSPGEFIENKRAATLAQVDPVAFDAILPADLHATVKAGLAADIGIEQAGARPVRAVATIVDPYVDAASGTFRARFEAPNPDGRITPGNRCRVRVSAAVVGSAPP